MVTAKSLNVETDRWQTPVTLGDIRLATQAAGLAGRPVCVHASLRSFGWVEGGAQTVVNGLLAEGCTVMVLTITWAYASPPPPGRRPAQNGTDYAQYYGQTINSGPVYSPDSQDIERDIMGAIPDAVLAMPQRVRGSHPRDSFTAIGPMAEQLISGQTSEDVYAPLRALAKADGAVVLMGVGLDKMTLLHLAEQQAGRRMFRRWANGANGMPIEVAEGGCSVGFGNLKPILSPLMSQMTVGKSLWRIFSAAEALNTAADAVRQHPMITHCGNPKCAECRDAVLGGPMMEHA